MRVWIFDFGIFEERSCRRFLMRVNLQENSQGWQENNGQGDDEVSFVVNVHEPFDIYPGMECRAMVLLFLITRKRSTRPIYIAFGAHFSVNRHFL